MPTHEQTGRSDRERVCEIAFFTRATSLASPTSHFAKMQLSSVNFSLQEGEAKMEKIR